MHIHTGVRGFQNSSLEACWCNNICHRARFHRFKIKKHMRLSGLTVCCCVTSSFLVQLSPSHTLLLVRYCPCHCHISGEVLLMPLLYYWWNRPVPSRFYCWSIVHVTQSNSGSCPKRSYVYSTPCRGKGEPLSYWLTAGGGLHTLPPIWLVISCSTYWCATFPFMLGCRCWTSKTAWFFSKTFPKK
jgi:hypothetical protein